MFIWTGSNGSTSSWGRSAHYCDRLHDFSVTIPRCYKDVYVNNFFPRTARPWNFLPVEYFPLTHDLNDFKSRIRKHLLTLGSFYALGANVCKKIMSFESSHVRLSKFSYILVSFMKEKHQKIFGKICFIMDL